MLKSRSVRLAVNLCVIVALLLPSSGGQPASAAECGPTASTEVCEGCGRCHVSHRGEHCGCCCKRHSAKSPSKLADKGISDGKSCCHTPDTKLPRDKQQAEPSKVLCLCGGQSTPAVPAQQNRSASERLVKLLSLGPVVSGVPLALDGNSPVLSRPNAPASLSPHEVQQRLCVWRI